MDKLDKGMIHVLAGTEQNGTRFHNATQKGVQLKTYELFICGTFHVVFLDHSLMWVTETMKSETTDKGG